MTWALYARISTPNQDLEDQVEKLEEWGESQGHDYEVIAEQVSSVSERPKFEKMMDNLDNYEGVAVEKLDRFGRSTKDILEQVNILREMGIAFRCLDQPILDMEPGEDSSPVQEAMMEMMATFASLERKMIRERFERGYQKALEEGRVGRDKALEPEEEKWAAKKYDEGYSYNTVKALVNEKYDKDVSITPIQTAVEEYSEDKI